MTAVLIAAAALLAAAACASAWLYAHWGFWRDHK